MGKSVDLRTSIEVGIGATSLSRTSALGHARFEYVGRSPNDPGRSK
jgi:hypothetical protein